MENHKSYVLTGGLPGRKRVLTDIEGPAAKDTVKTWLRGLSEGDARTGALYGLRRYLRWRKAKGLEADPDVLIESCLDGTVRTLTEHEKALLEYFEDPTAIRGEDTMSPTLALLGSDRRDRTDVHPQHFTA